MKTGLTNQTRTITIATLVVAGISNHAVADDYIDLGGPNATGFLAINNFKNSTTQQGIEGTDINGNPSPGHNGLPDYPNFQIPTGFTNAGVWTAIIASPQSSTTDYNSFLTAFYSGASPTPTINNQDVSQADFSTLSAGRINYDSSLVASSGSSSVGLNDLSFDFNTFEWDGSVGGDGGDAATPGASNAWIVTDNGLSSGNQVTRMISPFSPIYTEYNDGGGAGNAQVWYEIGVANLSGTGLAFEDGVLDSMDISGDLTVGMKFADVPLAPALEFAGTFTASGLDYTFSLQETKSFASFSGVNMLFNRAGTVSVEAGLVLGDLNGDGTFDSSDIPAFVQALTDESGYATLYPALDPDVLGDFDSSGTLDNLDIFGFVQALSSPSAELSSELTQQLSVLAVPEPASGLALLIGCALLSRRRCV
ncbi:MAG: PEP-CTERM sorting domain-containing protein [Planctomycetota bacterium]